MEKDMEYETKRDYTVGLQGFWLRTFQPYVRVCTCQLATCKFPLLLEGVEVWGSTPEKESCTAWKQIETSIRV